VRAVLAPLVVLVLLLVAPATVSAHANLERAEPTPGTALDQSPPQLRLTFSEAVDGGFSKVQVLDDRRDTVDKGDSRVAPDDPRSMLVSLPGGLPNGVYTVQWRTLSAVDGHTVTGAYPLIVGPMPAEGVASTQAASSQASFSGETALSRWWFYVAAGGLFGVLLAWRVVFEPLFGKSNAEGRRIASARARNVALGAAIVLLVGTLYGALAQAAVAGDVPLWGTFGQPLVDLLSRGRFAVLWWARLGLVVLALVLVSWRGVRGWSGLVALAAGAVALLTSSLNSHAAALLSGAYLGIAFDWIHFLGVAAWIGGLVSIVFVLPLAVQRSESAGDRVLAQAVARFSALALLAVVVIIVSGTFQAWLEVGSWEGLLSTVYGHTLLTKIGLLLVVLAVAAFNLFVARPQLAALATRQAATASTLARRFSTAVRAEVALLGAVLIAAAILTGVSPAREEIARRSGAILEAGPVDRVVDASGLAARIQITPASIGQNRLAVELPGIDPNQVERVQLTMTYLDAEFGSQPLVLPPSETQPGRWEISSPLLSQAGTWQAELFVRRAAQDDARTAFRFLVAGPGGAPQPAAAATGAYPLLPSPMISVAYVLIAAGWGVIVVAFARVMRQTRRGRRAFQRQAALLGAGLLVIASGGYLYAQEMRNGVPLDVANIRDPIPPDDRSLAVGQRVYTTYCETCHGETGRGDGPSGLRLVPRPADLRIHSQPGVHLDGELFYWVSYGFPGSAMPAWKDTLTEEERWDVINYVRATFGNVAAQ
jgi:copper transport protein